MVPPASDRVSRAPPYSGYRYLAALCPYGALTRYGPSFQRVPVHRCSDIAVLQPRPCLDMDGLDSSGFARRYSRNHSCFLFLRLLRCFSSPGSPSLRNDMPSACRVAPFGHPRITSYVPIPADFRSLSRPSSPLGAQASPIRPYPACRRTRDIGPRARALLRSRRAVARRLLDT